MRKLIQYLTRIKSFRGETRKQRKREEEKKKTLKNAESGSETESLVTDEIYDRLLAAEIDSLSKLIRNRVFYISRFVACFFCSKLHHVILFFNSNIFSIILIPITFIITFNVFDKTRFYIFVRVTTFQTSLIWHQKNNF